MIPLPPVASIKPPFGPAPVPGDDVRLINSEKNGVWTSGLAWYRKNGGGDGRQLDAYIDIKTDGTVDWEGNSQAGKRPFQCLMVGVHS